jgi:hypothetical protein
LPFLASAIIDGTIVIDPGKGFRLHPRLMDDATTGA